MTTEPTTPDEHAEPVTVATFPDIGGAQVAQVKLRAYGIEAVILDEVEGGAVPVDGEPGVVVQVRAADAADARQLLTTEDEAPDSGDLAPDD